MPRLELSVVVTVYSETFSIVETVERLERADRGHLKEIILVVSPRSSRESMEICAKLRETNPRVRIHIQQNNPGLGWAYREGMQLATGTHIGLMSADLETEPEAIERMARRIEETGADGCIANRWLKGGGFVYYDRFKKVLNYLFQKIFKWLYWTPLGDLTYGLKILSKECADSIAWEGILHEIAIETTVKPLKKGFKMEQVPSIWIGRREGVSKNTFFRNFRYVKMALKVWWRGA